MEKSDQKNLLAKSINLNLSLKQLHLHKTKGVLAVLFSGTGEPRDAAVSKLTITIFRLIFLLSLRSVVLTTGSLTSWAFSVSKHSVDDLGRVVSTLQESCEFRLPQSNLD